ncbi:MAG TPA: GNAT family N-acetyltransferase, partial [Patescibacteria group bacterium]|nr:GNAT family N-acetyltransferase [Patescibacteria group bacterium]
MPGETRMPPDIRRARPDEIEVVRRLIVESMGHWDRGPAYLAEAAELMSLDAGDLERDEAFVVTIGPEIVGFSRVSLSGPSAEIEELHVRPGWIGKGFGRALFEHAAQAAAQRGAVVLRWSTDPYALGFYERMGGRVIGTEPSGIANDAPLTLMEIELAHTEDHRPMPSIELREITEANRDAVLAIHAGPAEGRFVSSVADSIEEAAETPEGNPWYRAVYLEGEPVGFVMLSWDVTP